MGHAKTGVKIFVVIIGIIAGLILLQQAMQAAHVSDCQAKRTQIERENNDVGTLFNMQNHQERISQYNTECVK